MSNFCANEISPSTTACLPDPEVTIPEEEDKNAFECDDCNSKGIDCYEQLGLTKEECLIYMDLGEPDRCEDCFGKWKNTSDAADYLKQTEEEEDDMKLSTEEIEECFKEQQIDAISNGECPTISYDLWLSRLTSEQREVEKEKQIQWEIKLKEMAIRDRKQQKEDEEEEEEEEEEEIGEEQFRCPSCKLVQSMSTCYLCGIENTCEICVGDGGVYGEDEEWICHPCDDKQPEEEEEEEEECVEEYPFYLYHIASFGSDRDNCPACDGLCGKISEDELEALHAEYDHDDKMLSIVNLAQDTYSRQKFIAYLKPSTYKRLTAETLNTNTVLYALADMILWGVLDVELGLDELDDDEIVTDPSDDMYVCYANGTKEYKAFSYFREHKIHLCFDGSQNTMFAEWHDDAVHLQN